MKAAFVWAQPIPTDATEWHKALPRVTRKALRHTTPKATPITKTNIDTDQVVTDWLAIHDPMNDAEYLALNTCDPDFCMDEFNDVDDEYAGLTIVAPGKDTRRWLKGYNIL